MLQTLLRLIDDLLSRSERLTRSDRAVLLALRATESMYLTDPATRLEATTNAMCATDDAGDPLVAGRVLTAALSLCSSDELEAVDLAHVAHQLQQRLHQLPGRAGVLAQLALISFSRPRTRGPRPPRRAR